MTEPTSDASSPEGARPLMIPVAIANQINLMASAQSLHEHDWRYLTQLIAQALGARAVAASESQRDGAKGKPAIVPLPGAAALSPLQETTDPRIAEIRAELKRRAQCRGSFDVRTGKDRTPVAKTCIEIDLLPADACTWCLLRLAHAALTVLQQQLAELRCVVLSVGGRDIAGLSHADAVELSKNQAQAEDALNGDGGAREQLAEALRLAEEQNAILCRTADALTGDEPLDDFALSFPLVRLAADTKAELDALLAAREAREGVREALTKHGICRVNKVSSRVCELGTSACDVRHSRAAAPEKGGQ